MYVPDCPFEVTTTNRYTIDTHEASVTARREIKRGEEIKYLTGIQVALTEKEEDELDDSRLDFSIVVSSRKKTRSLFLGPARFANHDCDANAKLSTKGPHGMQIVSVKKIEVGDEITVSYGDNYFGEDNQECLCGTCERNLANGWALVKDDESAETTPVPEEAPEEGAYSLRRKRKYGGETEQSSKDSTPALPDHRKRCRVETPVLSTPAPPVPLPMANSARKLKRPSKYLALNKARSMSSLRQEVPISSIEDPTTNAATGSRAMRNQQHDSLLTITPNEADSSRNTTPQSLSSAASPKSTQSTDATSIDEYAVTTGTHDAKPNIVPTTLITSPTHIPISALLNTETESELSELSESYELDDTLLTVKARRRSKSSSLKPVQIPRTTRSASRHTATPLADPASPSAETAAASQRRPGDYTLSRALLAAKYSRWVQCRTCDADFVQADAYHTRIECPRCERHSKLYGYAWPKTDREGKGDREERVLDHRTIHRFVEPEEERNIKKGKRRGRLTL
jgi:histone-lysine N-methyltransferase SUV420H